MIFEKIIPTFNINILENYNIVANSMESLQISDIIKKTGDTMKSVNYSLKYFLLALLFVNAGSCKAKTAQASDIEIGIESFVAAYEKDSNIQLVDVRTPEEFASGHVPKAVSVPLNDLTSGSATVPFEKNSEIYVICRSGKRSLSAVQYLKEHGYTNLKSVSGGTMAWSSLNKPLDQ